MKTLAFLAQLRKKNIFLQYLGDQLLCTAQGDALDEDLRQELRSRKSEILAFLKHTWEKETPLTSFQKSLWTIDRLSVGSGVLHRIHASKRKGAVTVEQMQRCLDEVVARHSSLRKRFVTNRNLPHAVISREMRVPVDHVDLSAFPADSREDRARKHCERIARKPFDLQRGPLLRVGLLHLAEDEFVCVVVIHQIVADEKSLGLFLEELDLLLNDGSDALPIMAAPVDALATRQKAWLESGACQDQANYWRRQLDSDLPVMELTFHRERPESPTVRGTLYSFDLDSELITRLGALASAEGVVLSDLLLAAYKILLYHHNGHEDIVVGTYMDLPREEVEKNNIDCFSNVVLCRTKFETSPAKTLFRHWLEQVRDTMEGARRNNEFPFENLAEELQLEQDRSRYPLCQVLFHFRSGYFPKPESCLEEWDIDPGATIYELALSIRSEDDACRASFLYNPDLFKPSVMKQLAGSYLDLLRAIVASPARTVMALALPALQEKEDKVAVVTDGKQAVGSAQAGTTEESPSEHCTRVMEAIGRAWKQVLPEGENIDFNQSFFELGGDSLGMLQVYDLLPDILKNDLERIDLFKSPTIAELARYLERHANETLQEQGQDREQILAEVRQATEAEGINIAIIGMSGRFPGAETIEDFWQNLRNGVDCIHRFSDDELAESGVSAKHMNNPNYVKARGVLKDVRGFDGAFFGLTPREAQVMDPQQRLLLECSWEALERAGYAPGKYKDTIGVFGGAGLNRYLARHLMPNRKVWKTVGEFPIMITNITDNLCSQISYRLGLTGPSLAIQSACSSSLVAVHQACLALRHGDCKMALAGGASLGMPDKSGYMYEPGMLAPPDGVTRSFDAGASGATPSQGAAMVLLKRLEDAVDDGDQIFAIIRGAAVNNDGRNKENYTSYSPEGQTRVIRKAWREARFTPETITHIETSSTASTLGDPIEFQALCRSYDTHVRQNCALGAVKTNIGSLDTAAGVTALIKTALALHHQEIPPVLHYETPNPNMNMENSPFYINTKLTSWQTDGLPRRAGVSGVGLGGTNAHLALEECPRLKSGASGRPWKMLTLSAKTATALDQTTNRLVKYLAEHRNSAYTGFADVAYTLHVGREDFGHRRLLVCRDAYEAVLELSKPNCQRLFGAVTKKKSGPVAFMFPGQGAQYQYMGQQLYKSEPYFRNIVDQCWHHIDRFDTGTHKFSDQERTGVSETIHRTYVTQPALFILEYALARLLMHWGIRPEALIGNSLGELVAATVAGVFDPEDALATVIMRGELMRGQKEGRMITVYLSEEQLQPFLNDELSLAAVVGPTQCVLSGSKGAVDACHRKLNEMGVRDVRLPSNYAFHSYMMEPIVADFRAFLSKLVLRRPKIPFISNPTGDWITDEQATDSHYWANLITQPVRFSRGLEVLFREPDRILLEVGPDKTLSMLANVHPGKTANHTVLGTMRQPLEDDSDVHCLLTALGRLWLRGVNVDWQAFHEQESRLRLTLPTYPFERTPHWIEATGDGLYHDATLESDIYELDQERGRDEETRPNVFTEFVAPRDNIETGVAEAWCKFLGLKKIGVHDDFFELGGSSLIAIRLLGELAQTFNIPLASHLLLKKRTVASIADYIKENRVGGQDHDDSSPLVEIQRGNPSVKPLFLVHPIGGDVYFYRDLANCLGVRQPVHAFQAPSLVGKGEPFDNIVEQAAAYNEILLDHKKSGPYIVGGSSYGGVVAYEMAQQLTAAGHVVPLVVLIDSPTGQHLPHKMKGPADILDYLVGDELNISADSLRELEPAEQLNMIFEEARHTNRFEVLPPTLGLPMFNTWMAHQEALFDYHPKAYSGRVLFYKPRELAKMNAADPHLTWLELAQGGFELVLVPGDHLTMNAQPHVKHLARHLKRALREA